MTNSKEIFSIAKTDLKIMKMKNTLLTNLKFLVTSVSMILFGLTAGQLVAQVDCDAVTITCNDMVQVSLNSVCEQALDFDMIVENPADDATYTVTLSDLDGNPLLDPTGATITDNVITLAQAGDTIMVTAQLDDCSISCWGYASVFDKLAPQLTCTDLFIDCDEAIPMTPPTIVDNCGDAVLTFEDLDDGIMCDVVEDPAGTFTSYSSILERVWTATDGHGNSSSCSQFIHFAEVSVDDVVFPSDFIVDYNLDSLCSVLDLQGVLPEVSGEPTFFGCPSLQFQYSDLEFEMCGASTKMLRTWFVVDWCSGEFREEGQNIEAFDDEAPVAQCGETCYEIFTTDGCTVDFNIPVPVNGADDGIDPLLPSYIDCSDVTYRIFIGFVDQDLIDLDEDADPCGEEFNDLPITYEEVLPNSAGEYIYEDATLGLYWYRYEFVDACGNVPVNSLGEPDFCTADVIVKDGTDPFAICEGNTKVSLNASLEVEVLATSIDDNSFDECSDIVLYEVKRIDNNLCESSDATYGPTVTFCCTDAHGQDIPVMLRVTDAFGNTDECVGSVCVSDFVTPVVLCPANDEDTIECGESFDDAVFGEITVSSNCPGTYTPVTTYDDSGLNECGVGEVIKTVTYNNSAGVSIGSCDLIINVIGDGGLSMSDITCPGDVIVTDCGGSFTPAALNSMPVINLSSSCADVVMNYVDGEPFQDPNVIACYSIIRKWTIVDWCTFDIDSPNTGEFFCEQQLNFNSSDGPTFTTDCDEKITVADSDLDCEHEVVLLVQAIDEDGCTPSSQIDYTWELDADSDGIIDGTGTGNDATGVYPVGCHEITFFASDNCGNITECTIEFCVTSDKEPTPICRAELVWALGADGTTEVWASDFNIKSESACGTDSTLTFSFTEDGLTPALDFTCDDIPNGIGAEISLNMYVMDSSGNSEFCQVTLILQDNLDACLDSNTRNAFVAGRVYDENYKGVEEFEVELEDMTDADTMMELTDEEGDYQFESVEYYDSYIVEPVRNDLHKEGVSTLDIILIQRHILNLEALDSPYKLIAADANKSNSISSADLVELRKLILDVKDEFSDNTSWQFVDANQVFIDPTQPWEYETSVSIPTLFIDYANVEFVAVKTGDVNNSISYYLHNDETEVRGADAYHISTKDQKFSAGQQVKVTLNASQTAELYGAQFTVDFDASVLTYLDYSVGQLDLSADKLSSTKADAGLLTLSADFVQGREIAADSELTSIYFIAQQDGRLSDVLDLTSEVTVAEAYNTHQEVMEITLDFEAGNQISNDLVVYQNEPNPFAGSTTVPYYTTAESTVSLEVFDASGKTLYQTSMAAAKGHNKFTLSGDNVPSSGVLFYRVQSGKSSIVKKMILLDK